MQSKNYLEQRFNHLENTPIPELPVNSFLKFYQTKEEKNLTLGYIATSEPVVGLTKDFQAGVESEFEVHPQILGEEVFEVKVIVEPADKIRSLTTCEKQDGDNTVKFTPEVPGTFNIIDDNKGKWQGVCRKSLYCPSNTTTYSGCGRVKSKRRNF